MTTVPVLPQTPHITVTTFSDAELQERLDAAAALAAENERLRAELAKFHKLFEDAGGGEHNVLALIYFYQRESITTGDRIAKALRIIDDTGCDCECDDDGCTRCLGCRIGKALTK